MKRKILLTTLLTILLPLLCSAKLSTSHLFTDGVVLQQDTTAAIWGWTEPDTKVTVIPSWNHQKYTCISDDSGKWLAHVQTPKASYQPYDISIKANKDAIRIKDVLIGEVWFTSGQSNMAMNIFGYWNAPVEHSLELLSNTSFTNRIRLFNVPCENASYEIKEDMDAAWQKLDNDNMRWMSAVSVFFANKMNQTLDVPIGIICCAWGGTRVEGWLPENILKEYGENIDRDYTESLSDYKRPMNMYNGMLYPCHQYTLNGFLWYQGCSNVGDDMNMYEKKLVSMIQEWRRLWNDQDNKMPFYIVEIAPFDYGGNHDTAPLMRQAQFNVAQKIENGGFVGTNDLVYSYEKDMIHPCQKKEVGERLAYMALNKYYGMKGLLCDNPYVTGIVDKDEDYQISLRVKNTPQGLSRLLEIKGLEVAGSDNIFYPATEIDYTWEDNEDDREMIVFSKEVKHIKQVRYVWGDFVLGNIKNTSNLPLLQFWFKR